MSGNEKWCRGLGRSPHAVLAVLLGILLTGGRTVSTPATTSSAGPSSASSSASMSASSSSASSTAISAGASSSAATSDSSSGGVASSGSAPAGKPSAGSGSSVGSGSPPSASSQATASAAAVTAAAPRLAPPAVLTAGEINCAGDFGAPPNQFTDAAGKQQGVNPDIMAQVAKELIVQLKWTNLQFGSQIAGLQGKRFDAMCGSTIINADRLKVMYMIPYIQWGRVMMVRADDPTPVTCPPTDFDGCIQQLSGKTVLTGNGSIEHTDLKQWSNDFVKQGKQPINIQAFENQGQAAAALARGVGNVSYHEDPQAVYFMEQFPKKFKILFKGYKPSPVAITVRREPDAIPLADALVLGLQKAKADGSYADIVKKWNLTPVDSFDYQK